MDEEITNLNNQDDSKEFKSISQISVNKYTQFCRAVKKRVNKVIHIIKI